ncbi:hypothetical protein M0E87_06520 [Corynebacterium sp. CCM 9185]|uniref:Uncharacterized protein n=1 Tax=Corynebacterium marambiense TaxID=2765364 RepID=A0ABS0VWG9_9CORY|nr:hypothetical protein [Corynebacterium marambiense]MBI8999960.1 hypothetical protein [Corynebacterium marambiense]MCK7663317.1 hypothetical protein [Corynebacterium marambiense]MCX7542248.1 hypothetical protein [Corynebacterium marambiense]
MSRPPRRRVVRPSTAPHIDRSMDKASVTRRMAGTPGRGGSEASVSEGFDETYWRSQRPPHWD